MSDGTTRTGGRYRAAAGFRGSDGGLGDAKRSKHLRTPMKKPMPTTQQAEQDRRFFEALKARIDKQKWELLSSFNTLRR